MTFEEYQVAARRTQPHDIDLLVMAALGAAGESGELANEVKKIRFHGHATKSQVLRNELGDVLWYLACLADALGATLEDVAQTNIDKLRLRYPEGFSYEASRNRREDLHEL
uniref:Putative nucleotide pyrophosphohydrolase domain-containing protein n=1 Tax=viral metagenome TaxID=1070528 RepID=A0A6M3J164_9ZZZZ